MVQLNKSNPNLNAFPADFSNVPQMLQQMVKGLLNLQNTVEQKRVRVSEIRSAVRAQIRLRREMFGIEARIWPFSISSKTVQQIASPAFMATLLQRNEDFRAARIEKFEKLRLIVAFYEHKKTLIQQKSAKFAPNPFDANEIEAIRAR